MAWRIVQLGDRSWRVSIAAERQGSNPAWQLVLAFRSDEPGRRPVWAIYPGHSSSRSGVFALAEQLSDDALRQFLQEQLGGTLPA